MLTDKSLVYGGRDRTHPPLTQAQPAVTRGTGGGRYTLGMFIVGEVGISLSSIKDTKSKLARRIVQQILVM